MRVIAAKGRHAKRPPFQGLPQACDANAGWAVAAPCPYLCGAQSGLSGGDVFGISACWKPDFVARLRAGPEPP
jgi:hypothetical protein